MKTPQENGRCFEKYILERFKGLGCRPVCASGSQWHSKGDLIIPPFLVECKATLKESRPLKLAELMKIRKQALEERKQPAMIISLYSFQNSFAVIPLPVFEDYIQCWAEIQK